MEHRSEGGMSPAEYAAAVGELGLSGGRLAGQLGCHRNLPLAWEKGRLAVPPAIAAWISELKELYKQHPPPQPHEWRTRSAA